MKYRNLGHSPIELSAVGLGCMTMTGLYGAADENECIATIHAAIDNGVTFLDTSDAYGAGKNEDDKLPISDKQFVVIPGQAHVSYLGRNRARFLHVVRNFLEMPERRDG